MGLLDYYRQFDDVDPEEINRGLRERRRREKELALETVPDLDLSSTEWPEFPNSEVVNASIYVARGRVNGYPDRHADRARRALSDLHGVGPEQIAVGNGAAELLQAAAYSLLEPGDELLTPWPSYPLYPLMATRAGATPVAVDTGPAGTELGELRRAVTERTRVVVICNPNDPTGVYLPADTIGELIASLPERAHVLLDEALVHFQDTEHRDACLRLVEAFPRLLVIRTFSKIYGLSGLRAGYAVGAPGSARVLDAIAPVLGVNALTQAAIDQALKIAGPDVERRRGSVLRERARLLEALRELPVDLTDSQANFVWLAARGLTGDQLTAKLALEGVIVASGGPLGADDHVRISIRNSGATDRLLRALEHALAG
jgi:histidinol-phosphate aminotransferase